MPKRAVWIRAKNTGGFEVIPVTVLRLYPDNKTAEVRFRDRGYTLRMVALYSELGSSLQKAQARVLARLEKTFKAGGRPIEHSQCTKTAPAKTLETEAVNA